ncbi:MAG TPA: prepilin-type N-terminal cleavage/methylation domain-containing protein [Candidatus Dormibacteraeota bacterium]|nr:prepilin-type N-terminal cleavage/methylation domain-containing protein [Candidatus Dormibacteraeota bacterium]
MIKKIDQNGFTIIELLIATSVFTAVLFIVTYGVIQISKTYTNGFIRSQTQNIAVSLSDNITRDIEFSSTTSFPNPPEQSVQVTKPGYQPVTYYYFCTTQNEYFYIPGGSLYKIPIASLQSILASQNCYSPQQFINNTAISGDIQSLISSSNVEILNHTVYDNQSMLSNVSSSNGLYSVSIEVLYGNQSNLIQNDNKSQWICRPTVLIGPFCAIYNFSTQAYTQN